MTTSPPEDPDTPSDATSDTRTASPPDPGAPDPGRRVRWEEVRDLGRLRRTRQDRKVAGVAGGVARHLDVDPLIVRIALVVLVFFGGSGLVLYLAGWLFVPAEDTGRAHVGLDSRNRSVVLVLALAVAGLAVVGDTAGAVGIPWPLIVLGLLAVLLVAARSGTPGASEGHESSEGVAEVDPGPAWQVPGTAPAVGSAVLDPSDSRRPYRGPVLFWFALAALALALGLLAVADGAGLGVADGAYPALALAVVGGLLVLGSVWGRPGGLVALGLLAAAATVVTTASSAVDADATRVAPTSAAALADSYDLTVGELVVDLSVVEDLGALDGRTLTLDANVGRLELIVPPGLDVTGQTRIGSLGEVDVFGARSDAGGAVALDGGTDAPTLTVDAEVGFGEIVLRQTDGSTR